MNKRDENIFNVVKSVIFFFVFKGMHEPYFRNELSKQFSVFAGKKIPRCIVHIRQIRVGRCER